MRGWWSQHPSSWIWSNHLGGYWRRNQNRKVIRYSTPSSGSSWDPRRRKRTNLGTPVGFVSSRPPLHQQVPRWLRCNTLQSCWACRYNYFTHQWWWWRGATSSPPRYHGISCYPHQPTIGAPTSTKRWVWSAYQGSRNALSHHWDVVFGWPRSPS